MCGIRGVCVAQKKEGAEMAKAAAAGIQKNMSGGCS